LVAVVLGLALVTVGADGRAAGQASAAASSPAVGTPEAIAAARAHFTRGRDLYQTGAYREAIVELDAARALDPKAKDLVFNLAVVHEKLGEIDDALHYARIYGGMDLEPAERARAESYIKRLEGAKNEVLARRAQEAAASPPTPPPPVAEPKRGRIDVITVVAAAVAVGAAGAGTVLGIKALGDQPSNFVTGENGATIASEQSQQDKAHTEAVAADVCFGLAGAAAVAAAVLYFARYRDAGQPPPSPSSPPAVSQTGVTSLMLAPMFAPSSGGLSLGGRF
jgi:tetratricopeptide (TPR) repeat protein